MATDQRYCIQCGERRGESRLGALEGMAATVAAPATPATTPAAQPPQAASRRRSSSMTLIATVGLLLLAMGVGVLIGNKGGSSNQNVAQQPVVLGAPGATTAAGATEATSAASSKDASASASSSDKASVDANAVAKKNGVKLAPKDVKLNGKCDPGAVGCNKSGTFDGNYFGGN